MALPGKKLSAGASSRAKKEQLTSLDKVKILVALIVTFVWAISFIMDIIIEEYSPNPGVHAVMLLVAGSLFGTSLLKGDRD